jgi:hypothetical protein
MKWHKIREELPPIGKDVLVIDNKKNIYLLKRKTELDWQIASYNKSKLTINNFIDGYWTEINIPN